MLNLLLPKSIDNSYHGYKFSLWVFGLIVFMKTSIGLGTIFNGQNAAIKADGIPLDTFTFADAQVNRRVQGHHAVIYARTLDGQVRASWRYHFLVFAIRPGGV